MIEISPKSFEKHLTHDDAKFYVFSLGNGWRFPTVEELRIIHGNANDLENELHFTNSDTLVSFSYQRFIKCFDRDECEDDCFIRPVRDLKDD
jgi:hypothetical protein